MGFFDKLFTSKSAECFREANKWTKRAAAADQRGYRRLAADCRSHAGKFHQAGLKWRRSGNEAHLAHLEATDQLEATRPTRATYLGPRRKGG